MKVFILLWLCLGIQSVFAANHGIKLNLAVKKVQVNKGLRAIVTVNYETPTGMYLAAYRILGYKKNVPADCLKIKRLKFRENKKKPSWGSLTFLNWQWLKKKKNSSSSQALTISLKTNDLPLGKYELYVFCLFRKMKKNIKTDKYLSKTFKFSIIAHVPGVRKKTVNCEETYTNPALNPVSFQLAYSHPQITMINRELKPVIIIGGGYKEKVLAEELASYIQKCFGVTPQIKLDQEDIPAKSPLILIGDSDYILNAGIDTANLPEQGFRVESFPRGIAIVGGDISGLSYGVYDFIERFLGVRWYYPGKDGTIIPHKKQLVIKPVNYMDKPIAISRKMWPWHANGMIKNDYKLSKKQMMTHPVFRSIKRHYRGSSKGIGFSCHTPNNVGVHFKEHPETFELLKNGKRNNHTPSSSGGMPCYSHPKTLEWHISDLENFYKNGNKLPWYRKGHGYRNLPTKNIIGVSPPDKPLGCLCKICQKNIASKNGRWGTYSNIFGTFIENMSRETKKRWPNKTLAVLPYQNYTMPGDNIKLSGNVVAMICLMHGIMPMEDPRIMDRYDKWIEGWRKLTGRPVYVWEYLCWPTNHALSLHYPHTLKKFYMKHNGGKQINIAGSFLNGGAGPDDLPGQQWAARHPDIYCHFRLLWNPRFDVDAMMDEYLTLMYGPAREPMKKLFNHLGERCEKHPWKKVPKSWRIKKSNIHDETMPYKEALKLELYLKEARKLAGKNNVYRRRIDFYGNAIDLFMKESAIYHKKMIFPKLTVLNAAKVLTTLVIDGKLSEKCWRKAKTKSFRMAFLGLKEFSDNPTTVRAVWTNKGIILGLEMAEDKMNELRELKNKNTIYVYEDNSIQIFIAQPEKKENYLQIMFNSLGFQFFIMKQDGKKFGPELSCKIKVHKEKDKWTAEIFIPFSIIRTKVKIGKGTEFPINIVRNRITGRINETQRLSTRYTERNNDLSAFGTIKLK